MLVKRIDYDELKQVLKDKYAIKGTISLIFDEHGLVLQIDETKEDK